MRITRKLEITNLPNGMEDKIEFLCTFAIHRPEILSLYPRDIEYLVDFLYTISAAIAQTEDSPDWAELSHEQKHSLIDSKNLSHLQQMADNLSSQIRGFLYD